MSDNESDKSSSTPPSKDAPSESPSVRAEITEIIEELGEQSPVTSRLKSIVHRLEFNGPLPHPELFRQYGEVIPNAPERILKVFEEDSACIRELQRGALAAQRDDNKRVQWMAFAVIIVGYVMAFVFAQMNQPWLAGTILTTTIIGTIAGFLQTKRSAKRPKDDAPDEPGDE